MYNVPIVDWYTVNTVFAYIVRNDRIARYYVHTIPFLILVQFP